MEKRLRKFRCWIGLILNMIFIELEKGNYLIFDLNF